MFCSQCGKQAADGARFCPACGANLQGGGAVPGAKPKSSRGLIFAVAGIFVVAAAAGGYAMLAPAPVEKSQSVPPNPAVAAPAPEARAPEKPAEPASPAVAEPQAPAQNSADKAAAHKALDQKIEEEEAAAKAGGKK